MLIFIAGVHGVGKTFLGEPVAKSLGLNFASASSLIRRHVGGENWDKNKVTSGVDRNQEILVKAVDSVRALSKILVLDGHFVLRDPNGGLVRLAVDVFERLRIDAIVLMEAPVDVVLERVRMRGALLAEGDCKELADAESQHAECVAAHLGVPLVKLKQPSFDELRAKMERLINVWEKGIGR